MRFAESTSYKHSTVVRHQGMSVVLAIDEKSDIYYRVLALDPSQPEDDKCWSNAMKLAFAKQIRPAGMSLVTVDLKTAEKTANAPFQGLSDGKHVYLFRQSADNSLYVDRFILDPAQKSLNPNWETRFQRSQKRDLPDSRKDTTGATGMEGEPFLEPTTELTLIKDVQEGRFSVLLMPGRLPSEWRWQIFVTNSEGEIDSFSIRRGDDGLFDMSDVKQNNIKWVDKRDRFQTGPATLMYMQQEDALDENGHKQRFKRSARVMLAAPVGSAKYALELDGIDDFVCLENSQNLQIEGDLTIEVWLKIQDSEKEQYIMTHGENGVYLKIDSGKFQFGCQDKYAAYEIPSDDVNSWIHLAGVYNSEQQEWILYRNEEKVGEFSDPTGAVTVAAEWEIGRYFKGQINNVRLWNVARSATEILESMYQPVSGQEAGLAGCWPLDEGSGEIVLNKTGQNHGLLNLGYALNFDGIDDYVELPELNIDFSNGITVEAWVRYDSFQYYSRIIDFGNGERQNNILFANVEKRNDLEIHVLHNSTGQALIAKGVLEKNVWMHLAATVDNDGKAAIYKNGKLQASGNVHKPQNVNRKTNYLGRSNWLLDGYFDGSMQEVRLWNVARSEEEIKTAMSQPLNGDETGLVGYWPLNESRGDLIHDKTAGENHGTLRTGYAIDFDGLDDYIELPEINYDFDDGFTAEAWVRFNSFPRWSRIIDFGNGAPKNNIIFANRYISNDLVFQVYKDDKVSTITASRALEQKVWIHLAATVDRSGNAALYKNGILLQTDKINIPIKTNRTKNYIGRSNWIADSYFDGSMKDVRIWNVARTQEEIQRDMVGPPVEDETGLVGWWCMSELTGNKIYDRSKFDDKSMKNYSTLVSECKKESTSLTFDGMDDCIKIENFEWVNGGPVTVEFWVKVKTADVGNRSAFTVGDNDNPNRFHVHLPWSDKYLYWDYGEGKDKGNKRSKGRLEASFSAYLDQWTHVALVSAGKQGSFMGIYLNGKLVKDKAISDGPDISLMGLWIGKWGTSLHKGEIKDFRIWNYVRSIDEISSDMNRCLLGTEPGLVGYWPLDEGKDEIIHDLTNKNNGTLDVGKNDVPEQKWVLSYGPPDDPEKKLIEGPDKIDVKWGKGTDDPKNKWVVVPPIAVLDFGVSREGTLALQDSTAVVLAKNSGTSILAIPKLEKGESPMRVLSTDPKGLTFSAGVLNYAHTGDRPFLLDGADGLIHLYFRGDYSNFLVTQLDTLTARVKYTLPFNGIQTTNTVPRLHFIARQPGTQMRDYKISIVDGSTSNSCLVTMDNQNGIKEEWKEVPRDLEQFLAVINGTAPYDANDPLVDKDKLYNYESNVKRQGVPDLTSGSTPFGGSMLFGVTTDNLPETGQSLPLIPNIESVNMAENGLDCTWIPEPKGKALQFDGTDDYIELPPEKLILGGDMTVEAWINVVSGNNRAMRIINYYSNGEKFSLGLIKDENINDFKVFTGMGTMVKQTDCAVVSQDKWTHLAAVYKATNALKLDGQGYVDCGNDVSLNMKEAFMAEAWVTPKSDNRSQPEVILSKWGRTEAEQSWRLYIDTDGRPCFETRDNNKTSIAVKANLKLQSGKSYHLAGAFDAAPKEEWALKLSNKDKVTIDDHKSMNINGAITLEAWVKVQNLDAQGSQNILKCGTNPIFLKIEKGQYQIGNDKNYAAYTIPPEDMNTWIHLAGEYDLELKVWILYRNGIEVSRHLGDAGTLQNQKKWEIGGGFAGQINNVRIWDSACSREKILENMDKPASKITGPVGHWVVDQVDSYSGKVRDWSPNGNDGTLTGGQITRCDKGSYVQKIFAYQAGKTTEVALEFNGKNDYIDVGDNPSLAISNAITVEAWVKHCGDNGHIVNRGGGFECNGYSLFILNKKIRIELQGAGKHTIIDYTLPEAGTWHHLAFTWDMGSKKIKTYFDGKLQSGEPKNAEFTGPIGVPDQHLNIGRNEKKQSDYYFHGSICKVSLWKIARTQEEIQKDMDYPPIGDEIGLVGYWPLDDPDIQFGNVPDHSLNRNNGTLIGGNVVLIDSNESMCWRWLNKEDIDAIIESALKPNDLDIHLATQNIPEKNDILLIGDEQMRVQSITLEEDSKLYKVSIERGVNGTLAQEHPRGTSVYRLKPGEAEKVNGLITNNTKVNVGRSASEEHYFQGTIDEVRIWKDVRYDGKIQYYRDKLLQGDIEGLISYWGFDEGRGNGANDYKSSNHGQLIHTESEMIPEMWTPSAYNATLSLYINGEVVALTDMQEIDYGVPPQFSFGALLKGETSPQYISGSIDEVRLWHAVRTREQIRDNMYRALSGDEEELSGYWPLDAGEGDTIIDRTGNGQNGIVIGPQWIDSTAPISNEGPEVRNVYHGIEKPGYNKQIQGSPAAVEYGDMQWDANGTLFGVMKRCYIVPESNIQLITGFKIGDLELNFVCQVQTAPTLIGYIEGAPPVPSENLTVNDPKTDDYVGNCSIELTEAKETIQLYSASRDTGFDMSVDTKIGHAWGSSAVSGFGFAVEVFDASEKFGVHAYFEHSLNWLSGACVGAGINKTLTKSLVLGGGWEEKQLYPEIKEPRYLNTDVGRRYLPNNMGYALVKSATADLFALKMKQTGSLVAFQVMPNPDIPEDWNIIMFPLNPKYIKNGTLDGMVGLVADPDYPNAITGERGSYFKPLEAYALKEQIDREAKNIQGYFESFRAAEIGRRQAATHFQEGDPGDASNRLLDLLPEGELGYDWATGKDRRSMVNTYVWTADGGFYSEEEQFSSIRQESLGGSYSFLGKAGIFTELSIEIGPGFFFELDAMFGGHINTTVTKSKEEKAAFGLHVNVQGEGYLNKWEGDQDKQNGYYLAEPCPGKVDTYRFMTFYLAPKANNFDKFFEQVVDPEWLNGQGKYAGEYGANARALREARAKPNQVWRVLHRVTYVSRIPPKFEPTPLEAVAQDVLRPANIQANIDLIQEIERNLKLLPSNEAFLVNLGKAVDMLAFSETFNGNQNQSELKNIVAWWIDRPDDVKQEIRKDIMTYLKDFYESDLKPPEFEPEKIRITEGLQILYTFREGTGVIVNDVSNVGTPLNLTIKNKDAVSWIESGGLTITKKTIIQSAGAATKLIEAAKASNEITIEAWIKPANADQSGPARIVTLSRDHHNRNFTLGQYEGRYVTRLRTANSDPDGTDHELHGGNINTESLSQLVYICDASGTIRFYINGIEVANLQNIVHDFSSWDDSYEFALGNEFTLERLWKGEFHLVAIYSRALSLAEIKQNLDIGADISTT